MQRTLNPTTSQIIRDIYGEIPDELASGLQRLIASGPVISPRDRPLWDERDTVLITYADQVRAEGASPLQALCRFLLDEQLDDALGCVHLLPFCPYSSDDGFSVIDYLEVDPEAGSWEDIAALGEHFELMFDFVLNHTSQQHRWFQRYLDGDPQFAEFYIDHDPADDLSTVIRPRSLPLLSEFETVAGTRYIWTTFSADQVDLNYANPRVMLAMIETLVEYARRGGRIMRLDAIAYLWKTPGTNCIHLPQVHATVRLLRDVLDHVAPGTLILTETNVPHQENISYFGGGDDEAHLVYQFSLPPLLLDAIHSGDTSILQDWIASLAPPSAQTTFFNFTASHDGIGVRPLEGIVPTERVARLVEIVKAHGGRVSMRRNADGSDSPYELNITYVDAVADRSRVSAADHARRFLATQAIMLSLPGVPAVYFHSLVGSPNDQAGVEQSGQNRRINRHKYDRHELDAAIADPESLQQRIMVGYRNLLEVRRRQPALHPGASHAAIDLPGDGWIGFLRTSASGDRLAAVANLTTDARQLPAGTVGRQHCVDQLTGEEISLDSATTFEPFQVRWLTAAAE